MRIWYNYEVWVSRDSCKAIVVLEKEGDCYQDPKKTTVDVAVSMTKFSLAGLTETKNRRQVDRNLISRSDSAMLMPKPTLVRVVIGCELF